MKLIVALLLIVNPAFAAQSIYCPEGHAYIQVGMTEDDVINACGQPRVQSAPSKPYTRKIPMTQLIYTSTIPNQPYLGIKEAVLEQWSLPTGINNLYSIQFDIMEHKVKSIHVNGSETKGMNMCSANSVQVGDDESAVYAACGDPSTTNTTYVESTLPGSHKTEAWTYQIDQYQPPIHLTFVNGVLESID